MKKGRIIVLIAAAVAVMGISSCKKKPQEKSPQSVEKAAKPSKSSVGKLLDKYEKEISSFEKELKGGNMKTAQDASLAAAEVEKDINTSQNENYSAWKEADITRFQQLQVRFYGILGSLDEK